MFKSAHFNAMINTHLHRVYSCMRVMMDVSMRMASTMNLTTIKVVETLGSGPHASVDRCVGLPDVRHLAFKKLARNMPDLTAERRAAKWAAREKYIIDLLRIGNHPAIAPLCRVFVNAEWLNLVFDISDRGIHYCIFSKPGEVRLGEAYAHRTLQQILGAIQHMHSLNIPHYNICLENVIVTHEETWEVKLLNLGLNGSAHFKPPEARANEGKKSVGYHMKADIWSCGAILFLMLFGAYYHHDHKHAQGDWRRQVKPPKAATDVPDECAALLDAMLIPRPEERVGIEDAVQNAWLRNDAISAHIKGTTLLPNEAGPCAYTEAHIKALIAFAQMPPR